jgi:hypothetical protein
MRRIIGIVCAAVVALTAAAAVFAAPPDKETVARTKAGDARATALGVHKGDLPAGWTGGKAKPNITGDLGCSTYRPKQSDLVLTGAAATHWQKHGVALYAQVQILRTPKMVKLDWQRTVVDPRVLPCIRKGLATRTTVVSFGRVAFPHLAHYSIALRAVLKVAAQGGTQEVEVDTVDIGAGRDEIGFVFSGLASEKNTLRSVALKTARALAKRLHG